MKRSWLVPVSLGAHALLFGALYAHGIWDIEQLPQAKMALSGIGVMAPPPAGGGEVRAKPLLIEQKKKIVHETTQPIQKKDIEKLEPQPETTSTPGDGEGPTIGKGSGSGEIPGDGTCAIPPCDGDPPKPEPIPDPPKPVEKPHVETTHSLPPKAFKALWESGEREIHPPDNVVTQMIRDDHKHVLGTLKVCISQTGSVESATIAGSTKYDGYDARLVEKVRQWHYHPYEVDGHAVRACSMVTFDYTIH